MSYTQVFGGTTIYPSDVSYLALTLNADKALEWPLESNDPANPAARVIDVTSSGSHVLTLPDATLTGAGQTLLLNNLSASSSSFTVKDYAGGTLATIAVGEQWQVYLAGTSTAAGTWRVFRYGASTATVQPSALAGYGVTVTSNTLSQSTPVTTFNTSPRTVLTTDRAAMLVWSGTGAGVLNLPSAAAVGNNFIVSARNSGGGDLTLAAAGSETIDGLSTLALHPGDSTSLATNGVVWYTLGLGQQSVFAFDYTSITVTGGNYTLSGSELNRIAYEFVGTLTSDVYIIVPPTIQQYWISNATSGAYSLYMRTASGTPVAVSQGARGIYYCNGANVVDADTSTVALPISAANGGTGITSYAIGDLVYANSATTLTKLSDVAVGNALISGGVGVAPSWGKIDLTTHITGTLPVTSGGTGQTAFSSGYVVKGSGSSALASSVIYDSGSSVGIGTTSPGAKLGIQGYNSYRGDAYTIASFAANSTLAPLNITQMNDGTIPTISAGQNSTGTWASIGFTTSAVERMRIDSSGNVGIGTTTPGRLLTVGAASSPYMSLATSSSANKRTGLLFNQSGVDQFEIGTDITLNNSRNWYLYDSVSTAARVVVDSSGNVGIGTVTPGRLLTVGSASAPYISLNTTSGTDKRTGLLFSQSGVDQFAIGTDVTLSNSRNWYLYDSVSAAARVVVDSSGNVGIGTTSPSAKLDVDGTTTTGNITVRGDGVEGGQISLNNLGNTASPLTLDVDAAGNGRLFTTSNNTNLTLGQLSATGGNVLFSTNGTERMRVDSSGNANVGNATATAAAGIRYFDVVNTENTSSSSAADIRLITQNAAGTGTVAVDMIKYKGGGFDISNSETGSGGYIGLTVNGNGLRINNAGNVGIGTGSPGSKLDVSGTVTATSFSGAGTGLTGTAASLSIGGSAASVSGTVAVANGGTGATAAGAARTNLGATTAGSNFFTLTNPSAVTFVRINADNTVSTLDAATFRTAIGAGSGGGSVTSVDVSGGTTGLTTSGGPITGSGSITLAGTLAAANGGTGQSSYAVGDLLYASTTTALSKLADVATGNALISGGVGVAPSWGKIGLTTHISGTLPIANGGTNLTATPTNGQVLIGNGTGYTLAAITQGSGITVANGAGTITVTNAAPMVYPGTGISVSTGSAWGTSLTAPSGTIVGTSDTQTLTNKRVNPRVGTVTTNTTITPTADSSDQYTVTALASATTFAAPSGTPVDGQKLMLRIKDNGTGWGLSWTTSAGGYRVVSTTLPTTTVATKTLYVGCIYNSADGFWDVVAVAQQA